MASMLTHAVGTILAVGALVAMVMSANGEPWRVVSGSIFGGSLIALYLSSTLYHTFSGERAKAFFQILDHACIYLLIAGSYTPLTLVSLRGPWGWSLFGIIWFLAIAGVLLKTMGSGKKDSWWSTGLYLMMGWLVVIAINPVIRALPPAGFAWLVAGGVCYSVGVIFFLWRRLKFNHAIWHLWVLAGSACHVVVTLRYVIQ
jgi:hemolysin III